MPNQTTMNRFVSERTITLRAFRIPIRLCSGILSALMLFFGEPALVHAATPELVKDINTIHNSGSSSPGPGVAIGSMVYFAASDATRGIELWKSDGTAAGTVLVKDIISGVGGSFPQNLVNVNGTLFFRADDGVNGSELWKSDGTAAGTVLVKDIQSGYGSSSPWNLVNVNGTLFFSADDGVNGSELWKSDGTAAGTVLVKDIESGSGSSFLINLLNINGTLFFSAYDGVNGSELWKSDGTEAGTLLVKDIASGVNGSNPKNLVDLNGDLFFNADDRVNGAALWKSDGTETGTVMVKNFYSDGYEPGPHGLVNIDGTLFFIAENGWNTVGLWKSDGTEAGTVLVKDFFGYFSISTDYILVNVNGTLYLSANDGVNGQELWKSDGTAAGTVLVKDIRSGSGGSGLRDLVNMNGTLFFNAHDGETGHELWKSDGTAVGTVLVKDILSGSGSSFPQSLINVNGTLFFGADDAVNGRELWKSDGTVAGTVLVKDIVGGNNGSLPQNLVSVNGTLFFTAYDEVNGFELWKSDGTAAGTIMVKDIRNGSGGSFPRNMVNVNGILFFSCNDGVNGEELWKSDGTAAGTVLVKDIWSGGSSSSPGNYVNVNGTLFFSVNDATGLGLWKSDGTEPGTVLVKTIPSSGVKRKVISDLIVVNETLFFPANDAVNGYELWKSDGTEAGTMMVKDIFSGSSDSDIYDLVNMNGTLFFFADDGVHGYEFWQSDGTEAGTVMVKDINSGSSSSDSGNPVNLNGTLFFIANDGISGFELWKSDGSAVGTVLVKDIVSGSGSSFPVNLVKVNETLFFRADDGVNGYELWKSDGTAAGTTLVKDILSGSGSSSPQDLVNANGMLFFSANDGVNGQELWKSDGTEMGTVLVGDITGDSIGSNPSLSVPAGENLFFAATRADVGRELFHLSLIPENAAPTDILLGNQTASENESVGTVVGEFTAVDADLGDTHEFALVSGEGDVDNASFTIDGATLKTAATFDYETKSIYCVRVRVTDSGELTFDKAFIITVANVIEPIVIIQQPTNQVVAFGDNAVLNVSVTGDAPQFQWQKNGTNIASGTDSSFAINNASLADAGNYSVVITNALGSVTSSNAMLFVTGTSDTNKPTITVYTPAANQRFTNLFSIPALGIAKDVGLGVAQVFYRVNSDSFQLANTAPTNNGATAWSATLALAAGTNKVQIKAIDFAGNESAVVTRSVYVVAPTLFTLTTNGSGTTTGPADGEMLEAGRGYTIQAIPAANNLFSNWSGSIHTNATKLAFLMQPGMTLTANFVTNHFLSAAGAYNGLFFETNAVAHESSGFINLNVKSNLSYTLKLIFDGDTISTSGKFKIDGTIENTLSRIKQGKSDVTLSIALDFANGTEKATGTISTTNWIAELEADRATFSALNQATAFTNKYTMIIPGFANPTDGPPGYGYGLVTVLSNGFVKLNGATADGLTISQSVPISKNGEWPFYVPLYKAIKIYTNGLSVLATNNAYRYGSILSWIVFTNNAPTGAVSWIKTGWTNAVYPNGFTNNSPLIGSRYEVPSLGNRAVNIENGTVTLTNGNLSTALTRNIFIKTNNSTVITPTNNLVKISITPKTGLLSGTFRHPDNGEASTKIKGAILQEQNFGGGFFDGTNEGGMMLLEPQ